MQGSVQETAWTRVMPSSMSLNRESLRNLSKSRLILYSFITRLDYQTWYFLASDQNLMGIFCFSTKKKKKKKVWSSYLFLIGPRLLPLSTSEQICLDGRIGFSVEGRQDSSKRPGHTVRRLPGLQNLLSLNSRLGHSRVGRPQAGPAGGLQPLEDRGAGGVGVAAIGGGRARAQAGGAPQVPIGRAGQGSGAVGCGAAGGLLGLVIIWRRSCFSIFLPPRAVAAVATRVATRAVGLGIGCPLLLAELGTPVLEPHL